MMKLKSRAYGPKTNKYPTCTTTCADHSRRKLEEEYGKILARKKCSDPPECLSPPPPFSNQNVSVGESIVPCTDRKPSPPPYPITECPYCSFDFNSLKEEDNDGDEEMKTRQTFKEVREILLEKIRGHESFGIELEVYARQSLYISKVYIGSPAHYAGIKVGDEIKLVNRCKPMDLTWEDLLKLLNSDAIRLAILPRQIAVITKEIILCKTNKFGLRLKSQGNTVYVSTVVKNFPAHWAGIREGDEIVAINGMNMMDYSNNDAQDVECLVKEFPNFTDMRILIRQIYPVQQAKNEKGFFNRLGRDCFCSDGGYFYLDTENKGKE